MTCPAVLRLDVNGIANFEIEKNLRILEVSVKGTRTL